MNAEPNIRLYEIRQKLQRNERIENGVTISSLTEQSEMLWAQYLRDERAKKMLTSQNSAV